MPLQTRILTGGLFGPLIRLGRSDRVVRPLTTERAQRGDTTLARNGERGKCLPFATWKTTDTCTTYLTVLKTDCILSLGLGLPRAKQIQPNFHFWSTLVFPHGPRYPYQRRLSWCAGRGTRTAQVLPGRGPTYRCKFKYIEGCSVRSSGRVPIDQSLLPSAPSHLGFLRRPIANSRMNRTGAVDKFPGPFSRKEVFLSAAVDKISGALSRKAVFLSAM